MGSGSDRLVSKKGLDSRNWEQVVSLFFSWKNGHSFAPFPPPERLTSPHSPRLKQPNPCKKQEDGKREREPGSPTNARAALGHAEHAIHGASEAGASVVEAVVHVGGEGGG